MRIFTTRPIGFINCLVLLTVFTYWPASGQVAPFIELCPGNGDSVLDFNNTEVDGYVYFAANDCVYGEELWRTDGTPGGTEMVADIHDGPSGSKPRKIMSIEETLFFTADDGKSGVELWKFDTRSGKAEMVADISSGASSSSPRNLIQLQDMLFFYATTPSLGYELWRSDGSEQGTVLVKDIFPGPVSTMIFDMVVLNDLLLFWAEEPASGIELWRSDGTTNGTYTLKDIFPGYQDALVVLPPWTLYGVSYEKSAKLTRVGDKVFFFASDGVHGSELWVSNGTKTGTVLAKDINPGPASSYPSGLTQMGDNLLLAAADATNGRELWMLDPNTFDHTVFDINPGNADSSPIRITPAKDDIAFFSADDGVHGRELWVLNGKKQPTLIADINSGAASSTPKSLFYDDRPNNFSNDGMLIFTADDGRTGAELWASFIDPSFHTEMIHEFTTSISGGTLKGHTKIGSTLFFMKFLSWTGFELWSLDVGNPGSPFLNFNDEEAELAITSPHEVPTAFTLAQNYPNPFNPSTVINFTLPESAHVRLRVFDMLGREVRSLVDGNLPAGHHQVTFRADDLPSGTYLYSMQAAGFTSTRMMHLTK